MSKSLSRVRLVITGRIQGVGFRCATLAAAEKLVLAGWVRNQREGKVEAVFEGPEAAIAAMVAWCREGPPAASVVEVQVIYEVPVGLQGFEILPTT